MVIEIRSARKNLRMPIPAAMAKNTLRLIPQSLFDKAAKEAPESLRPLICRETLLILYDACKDMLYTHKGLEVFRFESPDGAVFSVTL